MRVPLSLVAAGVVAARLLSSPAPPPAPAPSPEPSAAPSIPPAPELVTRTLGRLKFTADTSMAFPGGLLVVRLARPMGATLAVLHGRRVPFLDTPHGPRALMPVPVTAASGPTTLGFEVWTRRGRQRVPTELVLPARSYGSRSVMLPEHKRGLLNQAGSLRDGRRLLLMLRLLTPLAQWNGPFGSPVAAAPRPSFGLAETFIGGSLVNGLSDSIFGEYHRGLDYEVPEGTVVAAPAAGTVTLAASLTLTGQTLVLDHGQGVVSAFFHLGRVDVHEGERVEARAPIALSGSSGLAAGPHVHWGVYVHGVAVDPIVLQQLRD